MKREVSVGKNYRHFKGAIVDVFTLDIKQKYRFEEVDE